MKCDFLSHRRLGICFSMLIVFALTALGLTAKPEPKPKASGVSTSSLPMAKPEEEGFSSERLQRIHEAMQRHIDDGEIAGVVTLVSKNGKIIYYEAHGMANIAAKKPMQKDYIFNMASASKPITATAILMLMEEGRIRFTDPVSKYVPEFKGEKVRLFSPGPVGRGGVPTQVPTGEVVPVSHDITIVDLLTHTSGLMSVGAANVDKSAPDPEELVPSNLKDFVPRFAAPPLDFQPGTKWAYSNWAGYDVLGRIVEVVSGKTFDQFLKERVFEPLGMKDTWYAPQADPVRKERLATRYQMTPKGLVELTPLTPYSRSTTYFSGAAGLSSTAEDYWKFMQMLVNGGEFNGKRLLSPASVSLMISNNTGDLYPNSGRKGEGFGLGVSMILDRGAAHTLLPNGTFGWPGASGCKTSAAPKENIVLSFMVGSGSPGPATQDFETTVMQALLK
jgi:CubicO group peptidase (beta-lactamase class C family)